MKRLQDIDTMIFPCTKTFSIMYCNKVGSHLSKADRCDPKKNCCFLGKRVVSMHDSVFFKLKQAHPILLHHVHRASLSWGGSSLVWDKSPRTSVTQIILNDSHILINTGNSAAHVISSILTLFVHLSHISPPARLPWGVVEKSLILSLSEKRLPKRQCLHTTS